MWKQVLLKNKFLDIYYYVVIIILWNGWVGGFRLFQTGRVGSRGVFIDGWVY
jgi:hypothetical protein